MPEVESSAVLWEDRRGMALGSLVRRIIGPRWERPLAYRYRSLFVDLEAAARELADQLPETGSVLDVGGGDGELLNGILRLRPSLGFTMVDVGRRVGAFVEPSFRSRVRILAGTDVHALASRGDKYACVMLNDVLHHVPVAGRAALLHGVGALLKPSGRLIIKDVAPGGPRALMAVLADRYITGDRHVRLIDQHAMRALVEETLPLKARAETGLYRRDPPNYVLSFERSPL